MRPRERNVEFAFEHGFLDRRVTFPDGRSYVHRCERAVFEVVARHLDAGGNVGETMTSIAEALDLPFTQVNVALEFLKERGCVVTRGRLSYPAGTFVYEDAMVELLALEEDVAAR